ncbi:MAG: tyrosine-protein phosphatase [Clostridia bacterium]|nr:tyrosine-protein phosphatase [Clostridia bacterium]MBR6008867.1 tyrosine-protein phosphatase [Clostridia bacterium]
MKQFSRFMALALALCLCLGIVPVLAEEAPVTVTEIQKYGNMVLSVSGTELLARGFAYGDVVTVSVNGQAFEMPVCTNFSDVEQGSMILRVVIKPETGEDYVLIAINMGDFATYSGVATKEKTEADPGYVWHYNEGVETPVAVTVEMKEPGAYYDTWVMNQLVRSENREDYPQLTDAEYANFRAVATTGMGENKLYRSSSPVNPEINRNTQADAAAKEAGIKTFINLADNDEVMRGYEGFEESYYAAQSIIALNLGVDFSADDFKAGLADGVRFIAQNDAPFLVHCNEGKDRAGFVSAVLECLMGASADEITADYMVTFYNYYGVEAGTEQYDAIARANIQKSLAAAFGIDSITGADLAAEAQEYLLAIGVSEEEIAAVKAKLGE